MRSWLQVGYHVGNCAATDDEGARARGWGAIVIPFFEQPVLSLGLLSIHAFGVVIACAMLMGFTLAIRRARRQGLDSNVTSDLFFWALPFGLAGAHLFAVLAYLPGRLARDPWLIIRFWEELSSFGGMVGGLVGIGLYFRLRRRELLPSVWWAQLDVIAFTLPMVWAVGRLGCFLAHDHPGSVTTFFLARSLDTPAGREFIERVYAGAGRVGELPVSSQLVEMGFHDLGWYELLYLLLVVTPVFLWLDHSVRPRGFWVGAFLLFYTPARFAFDFLRVTDVRYFGWTPGQYVAMGGLLVGLVIAAHTAGLRRRPPVDSGAGSVR